MFVRDCCAIQLSPPFPARDASLAGEKRNTYPRTVLYALPRLAVPQVSTKQAEGFSSWRWRREGDGRREGKGNLNAQLVPCLRSGKKTAEAIVSRAAKAEGGSVAKWWCACIYERREGPSLESREKRGAPPWIYVAGLRCDWRQCNNPILQLCPLCSTQCVAVIGLRWRTCYSSVFV